MAEVSLSLYLLDLFLSCAFNNRHYMFISAHSRAQVGIQPYYQSKIDQLELVVREKTQNLQRLTAQRNELNGRVRLLREELGQLQEPGSYVGEVVKVSRLCFCSVLPRAVVPYPRYSRTCFLRPWGRPKCWSK
jgi:hypothetical protein